MGGYTQADVIWAATYGAAFASGDSAERSAELAYCAVDEMKRLELGDPDGLVPRTGCAIAGIPHKGTEEATP